MSKQFRALVDMALWKNPENRPTRPTGAEWYEWPAGTVFTPPRHMNIKRAIERGIVEEVQRGEG